MSRSFAHALVFALFVAGIVTVVLDLGVAGVDDTWLLLVAGVALVVLSKVAHENYHTTIERLEPGVPERPASASTPGDDTGLLYGQFLRRVHEQGPTRAIAGLRAAAIDVVARVENVDEEEAKRRVYDGTWTSDNRAAAFLSPSSGDESITDSITKLFGREPRYQRGVERVVDELVELSEVEPGTDVRDESFERGGDASQDVTRLAEHQDTNHWKGVEMIALVAVAIGAITMQPALFFTAAVGAGYATYGRSGEAPDPEVAVEHRLGESDPAPGDDVAVSVTVTNEGEVFLPDLRIVDVVPDELGVVRGTPRHGTALRPGESATFEYDVEARRGRHSFESTLVVSRSITGRDERASIVSGGSHITCTPNFLSPAIRVPLRAEATRYAGQLEIEAGGSGTEFFGVREYRSGDPLNRINWNRLARTGELSTLEFRLERAARVVIVIDARRVSRVAPTPQAVHAIDRSIAAAGMVFADLVERGDQVGITAFGPDECWLAPGSGGEHRTRAREVLADHPAFSGVPPADEVTTLVWERQLRRRLQDGTQVVVCTPLVDSSSAFVTRRLDTFGHPATVVSPDPTCDRTAVHRLAAVDRSLRIQNLRDVGIPVIDWQPEDSFDLALARSRERWSQ